tara:strand:+ start:1023 stop:1253 length:231 start_codon:yes stop_codon:yes gene_type:complete
MSYADSLTYEEGKFQGMQDIHALIYNFDIPHTPATNQFVIGVLQAIREQRTLIDEMNSYVKKQRGRSERHEQTEER